MQSADNTAPAIYRGLCRSKASLKYDQWNALSSFCSCISRHCVNGSDGTTENSSGRMILAFDISIRNREVTRDGEYIFTEF